MLEQLRHQFPLSPIGERDIVEHIGQGDLEIVETVARVQGEEIAGRCYFNEMQKRDMRQRLARPNDDNSHVRRRLDDLNQRFFLSSILQRPARQFYDRVARIRVDVPQLAQRALG